MTEQPAGSIYDLGYRNYTGIRLGRSYAILSLYLSTLRGAFGLGRGAWSKVFPMGLTALAFLPAVIQLGIGALVSDNIEITPPEDYYGYIRTVLVLFCAAVAPDLLARDQRMRTLSLYFSRALLRSDYALAKYAAFMTAMLFLTLGPQLLMYLGNALSVNSFWDYVKDEWDQAAPIVASAFLLSAFMGAVSLAIAAQSPRRAYTTIAIIALVLITATVAGIMGEVSSQWVTRIAVLVSPFDVNSGATYALFNARLPQGEALDVADLAGWIYVFAAVAWTAIGVGLLVRRYERLQA